MPEFIKRSRMPCSADELFEWHMRPGAFLRLAPPWEQVRVEQWARPDEIGRRATLRVRLAPLIWKRWIAEYREWEPNRMFRDVQISGPFARFDHRHIVEPDGTNASFLEDRIDYAAPLGALGAWLGEPMVRERLKQMFEYRHRTTHDDLAAHHVMRRPQRLLVTGSTGLVGSALVPFLTAGGHDVIRVTRRAGTFDEPTIAWSELLDGKGANGTLLDGIDGVVHLAGEGIANRRWTRAQKERIRSSRLEPTRQLCERLAQLPLRPKVLVCASAIGIYGDRADQVLTETSAPGDDFLAGVCRAWEDATEPARAAGIRVVNLRFGVVVSPRGGALAKMLPPFLLGGGGVVGSGRQHMSWIALDDALGVILHSLATDSLSGPVNAVAPHAVTNREWTKTLGRVLRRPTILPMPAFAARLAFGELADALLLSSQRVVPDRLLASGYRYRYADLDEALRFMLGRTA